MNDPPKLIGLQTNTTTQSQHKANTKPTQSQHKANMHILANQLLNDEWTFIVPKFEEIHKITTFDDGNDEYSEYYNEWIIFGENEGKVAVFNNQHPDLIIKSLSKWKLE